MANSFAQRLRKWRKFKGLVQKQAAEVLKVNLRTYQNWEEGRWEPQELALAELERRMMENQ